MEKNKIEFTRISSDSFGNPRYVCHFLSLINEQDEQYVKAEVSDLDKQMQRHPIGYELKRLYNIALARGKKFGGRKFDNKQYGGGIVFQSYNIVSDGKKIQEFVNNTVYVKFLIEKDSKDDVFAYFPYYTDHGEFKTCYAHIGQHSSCAPEYAAECKAAKPKQYADLKKELENREYNLEIIK